MNNGTGHASSSTDETLSNGSHEASRDSNKFDYSKDQKNSAIISNGAINSNGAIDSNGVINSNSGHDSNYTKEEQNNGNFECICLDVWNRKACQAYSRGRFDDRLTQQDEICGRRCCHSAYGFEHENHNEIVKEDNPDRINDGEMDPGGNETDEQGTSSTPPQGETTIESDPKMFEKKWMGIMSVGVLCILALILTFCQVGSFTGCYVIFFQLNDETNIFFLF